MTENARPLLEQRLLPLGKHSILARADALEPVSEACSGASEQRVLPPVALCEGTSELQAELPNTDCDA